MFGKQNYLSIAQSHETVFRNILRDLQCNRAKRPGGTFFPEDLNSEEPLETLYEKYSTGDRRGVFTITDFTVEGSRATFTFADIATLSGGGAGLVYDIKGEEVEYHGPLFVMMS
jgi:hypothetical protein